MVHRASRKLAFRPFVAEVSLATTSHINTAHAVLVYCAVVAPTFVSPKGDHAPLADPD